MSQKIARFVCKHIAGIKLLVRITPDLMMVAGICLPLLVPNVVKNDYLALFLFSVSMLMIIFPTMLILLKIQGIKVPENHPDIETLRFLGIAK
ncbi:hypothetical protein M0P65_02380 [Candidatus Gracilibacteria bacterium]|jgi:hypothetical protein|nr:hypothetical protein [Candidatus Gracilibacteria bacterium]